MKIKRLLCLFLTLAALTLVSGCGSTDYSRDLTAVISLDFSATAEDVELFESETFGNADRRVISGKVGEECRVGYAQCISSDGKQYSRHYYSFSENGELVSIEFASLAGKKDESTECSHWKQYVDDIEENFGKWDVVEKSGRSEIYGNLNGVSCKIVYHPSLNVGFYRVGSD